MRGGRKVRGEGGEGGRGREVREGCEREVEGVGR